MIIIDKHQLHKSRNFCTLAYNTEFAFDSSVIFENNFDISYIHYFWPHEQNFKKRVEQRFAFAV